MMSNDPEPWYQMQNQPNHKGSIGDFAGSALTQCNLTWLSATWPRNITKSHLFMKFGSGTSPVLGENLGPSLRNMVPEHPSDLDPCSHLLASVFIADLEKAARGKMRPIFSGQFSWRTTNSNLAKPRSCFRHWRIWRTENRHHHHDLRFRIDAEDWF